VRVRGAPIVALALCACQGASTPNHGAPVSGVPFLVRVGSYELAQWPQDVPRDARSRFVERWQAAAQLTKSLAEERPSAFRAVERGLLLRGLFEAYASAALERGEPTERELGDLSDTSSQLLDQPVAVRAAEVYLPVSFVESNEVALQKMDHIRERVSDALSVDDFVAKVQAASTEVSAKVVGRRLSPLSASGKVVVKAASDDPKLKLEPDLSRAVAGLQFPGDLSPVIGTTKGYHLFYAIEIYPAEGLRGEPRAAAIRSLVAAERSRAEVQELRKALKTSVKVDKAENVSALLGRIGQSD
jgi:hypothetical protein